MNSTGSRAPKGFEKGNVRIRNMLASIERTFLPVGSQIGKYRIIEEIDRGGMAVVYKAVQLDLNREVALKVMPANISINHRFIERFLTEAHAVAKLSHANIVSIYEVATENNIYYLSMEYIPGKNLFYYLHFHKPKLVDVLEVISRLADALAYAHNQKIIHRDLKLNNVIMKDRLTPVLIDFGLAKAMEDEDTGGITRTGEIMGSPSYMAPERLIGGKLVDHRSDICSLGIMLYEMLTFKNPYLDQRNLHQTTMNVMEANPIAPRKLVPWLPVEIEAITLKAMAREMDARYQSMEEFKADINRYQRGEPVLAKPPSLVTRIRHFVKRNWAPLVIGILTALFSGLFSVSMYLQNRKAQSHWQMAFNEKFNNKLDAPDWMSYPQGDWVIQDGVLVGSSNRPAFTRLKRRLNHDILIECDINADSDDLYNAGIFLFGNRPDSAYCFHFNKNGEGLYGITFPGSSFLFQDVSPTKINTNKSNHITIERIQNSITFSINGTIAAKVWDFLPPLGKGHDNVGFFLNGSKAHFDNLKIYRRAIPQVPSPTLIANRFWERGDFESALDEYRGLLLDFQDDEMRRGVLVKMADCLLRLNRPREAYEMLVKSSNVRSKDDDLTARTYFLEGIFFSTVGDEFAADSMFKKLAIRFPAHPVNASAMMSALLRSYKYIQQSKPLVAEREIKVLGDQYKKYPERWGKLYLSLLDYYVNNASFDTALTVAQDIVFTHEKDDGIVIAAKIVMGRIYLSMGQTEKAKELFDQIVTGHLNSDGVWGAWMELAGIYEYDFMYRDAITIYQKIFRECPGSSPIHWMAAVKTGELLLSDSIESSEPYFKQVINGNHPFPKPRLLSRFYLGEISESEFKDEWSSLYPDDRFFFFAFARNALANNEKVIAKIYLNDLYKSLSTKSWQYFRVYKIMNNLTRW